MFAVLKTGGKQYKVSENDVIIVEKLTAVPGDIIQFDQVLMISDNEMKVGDPLITGAAVLADVIEQTKNSHKDIITILNKYNCTTLISDISNKYTLKKKNFFLKYNRFLKSKKIKYAATDVVRDEQNLSKKNNKLIEYSKKNNNLLVTPHIAGLTIDSERKAAEITIDNLVKYFNAK